MFLLQQNEGHAFKLHVVIVNCKGTSLATICLKVENTKAYACPGKGKLYCDSEMLECDNKIIQIWVLAITYVSYCDVNNFSQSLVSFSINYHVYSYNSRSFMPTKHLSYSTKLKVQCQN